MINPDNRGHPAGDAGRVMTVKTQLKNKQMKKLFFAAFLFSCLSSVAIGQNIYKSVSAPEFSELAKEGKFTIIDIRTSREFQEGHIGGAINIDFYDNSFEQVISAYKTRPVLIYARSSAQSKQAMDKLKSLNFKEVYELNNGLIEWRRANLPLVK